MNLPSDDDLLIAWLLACIPIAYAAHVLMG